MNPGPTDYESDLSPHRTLAILTRPQWLGLCIDVGYVSNTNLLWESGEALLEVLGDNLLD